VRQEARKGAREEKARRRTCIDHLQVRRAKPDGFEGFDLRRLRRMNWRMLGTKDLKLAAN